VHGVKKKTRQRIKTYAKKLSSKNPDIREDCLIQAYYEANMRDRRLYDIEMVKSLGATPTDDQ